MKSVAQGDWGRIEGLADANRYRIAFYPILLLVTQPLRGTEQVRGRASRRVMLATECHVLTALHTWWFKHGIV